MSIMRLHENLIKVIKNSISVIYEDIEIGSETNVLRDLGFDSITVIQLIVNIEEEFNIEFDESVQYEDIETFDKLKRYIEIKLEDKCEMFEE